MERAPEGIIGERVGSRADLASAILLLLEKGVSGASRVGDWPPACLLSQDSPLA